MLLRLFHASGTARSDELQVNTTTAGDQRRPSVSRAVDGSFFVVWQSDASAGDDADVQARPDVAVAAGGGFLARASTRFHGSCGSLRNPR